ncbi:MAG TPA: histidine kinase dimerization/phospho-acceptor domain-containing protein, partial [Myxococcales bacterium]|nr:histidine kinase dimerization/phospho-acceptor domain-containing protein [Myxococcales bacterium]
MTSRPVPGSLEMQTRLAVLMLALLLLLSAVTAALFERVFDHVAPAIGADLSWKAEHGARELAQTLELPLALKDRTLVQSALQGYHDDPDITALAVLDDAGAPLWLDGVARREERVFFRGGAGTVDRRGGAYTSWRPVMIEGRQLGSVAVAVSTERMDEWERFRARMLIAVGLACAAAIVIALLFVRLWLGPLMKLTETARQEAEEASRAKSRFLANMSHELRTPLNAMTGFTQLVMEGEVGPVSREQAECLRTVMEASRHLLQLINDVLDLSKVEAGKIDLKPGPVRLESAIAEVAHSLESAAAGRRLHIRTEIDRSLGTVLLDELRLKQVLYNYASNAIKFSQPGGLVIIRAQAERSDRLRLEVEDEGIGIQPE